MTADTKEKIRLIAEELFAKNGYKNTTLRAITAAADVNLASVNYHFGGKDALLEAIFDHHLIPLNSDRLERLDAIARQAEQTHISPDCEKVLRAFLVPTLAFTAERHTTSHFKVLVSQALHDPHETLRHIFFSRVEPVVHRFFDLLCLSRPDVKHDIMARNLSYILGAMSNPLRAHQETFAQLCSGQVHHDEVEILISFILHGMAKQ